jgi:hypothetical protein
MECEEQRTYPERAIPATSTKSHAVRAHAKATNPVLVTCKNTDSLSFQRVPDIAGPIIIATKQNASRNRERNGRNATENVVVRKRVKFTIGTNIE